MPIYEYECAACGHELEELQKLSDGPLRKCPECGKLKLQRKVSAAGFRLSGSGWYETDFKKDGQKNLAGDKDGDKSTKESSTKSESKKDAKKASGGDKAKPAGKKDSAA